MEKEQYIKFADVDVDGGGTDIEVLVKVTGPDITGGVIGRIKEAVAKMKKKTDDWTTDDCCDAAEEQLKTEGYQVEYIHPHEISF